MQSMNGRRLAVVISVEQHDDPVLRRFSVPSADVPAFAEVLGDPALGGFEAAHLRDPGAGEAYGRVKSLFEGRDQEDCVLIYFRGVMLTGPGGGLYLAAADTVMGRPADTAVDVAQIAALMQRSRAGQAVVLLDGRTGGPVDAGHHFRAARSAEWQSRVVVAATPRPEPPTFAGLIAEGVTSGAADRDRDGWIGVSELYDHLRERDPSVRQWVFGSGRQPWLARVRRPGSDQMAQIAQLAVAAGGDDLSRAVEAREALRRLATGEGRVAAAATAALRRTSVRIAEPSLDFGRVAPGTRQLTAEIAVQGPPLAAASVVSSTAEGLHARLEGNVLRVAWFPTVGRLDGAVTLDGPAGAARLTVTGEVTEDFDVATGGWVPAGGNGAAGGPPPGSPAGALPPGSPAAAPPPGGVASGPPAGGTVGWGANWVVPGADVAWPGESGWSGENPDGAWPGETSAWPGEAGGAAASPWPGETAGSGWQDASRQSSSTSPVPAADSAAPSNPSSGTPGAPPTTGTPGGVPSHGSAEGVTPSSGAPRRGPVSGPPSPGTGRGVSPWAPISGPPASGNWVQRSASGHPETGTSGHPQTATPRLPGNEAPRDTETGAPSDPERSGGSPLDEALGSSGGTAAAHSGGPTPGSAPESAKAFGDDSASDPAAGRGGSPDDAGSAEFAAAGDPVGGPESAAADALLVAPKATVRGSFPAMSPEVPTVPREPHPVSAAEAGSAQIGSAQTGSAQTGSAQISSARVGSAQFGSAQAEPAPRGSEAVDAAESRTGSLESALSAASEADRESPIIRPEASKPTTGWPEPSSDSSSSRAGASLASDVGTGSPDRAIVPPASADVAPPSPDAAPNDFSTADTDFGAGVSTARASGLPSHAEEDGHTGNGSRDRDSASTHDVAGQDTAAVDGPAERDTTDESAADSVGSAGNGPVASDRHAPEAASGSDGPVGGAAGVRAGSERAADESASPVGEAPSEPATSSGRWGAAAGLAAGAMAWPGGNSGMWGRSDPDGVWPAAGRKPGQSSAADEHDKEPASSPAPEDQADAATGHRPGGVGGAGSEKPVSAAAGASDGAGAVPGTANEGGHAATSSGARAGFGSGPSGQSPPGTTNSAPGPGNGIAVPAPRQPADETAPWLKEPAHTASGQAESLHSGSAPAESAQPGPTQAGPAQAGPPGVAEAGAGQAGAGQAAGRGWSGAGQQPGASASPWETSPASVEDRSGGQSGPDVPAGAWPGEQEAAPISGVPWPVTPPAATAPTQNVPWPRIPGTAETRSSGPDSHWPGQGAPGGHDADATVAQGPAQQGPGTSGPATPATGGTSPSTPGNGWPTSPASPWPGTDAWTAASPAAAAFGADTTQPGRPVSGQPSAGYTAGQPGTAYPAGQPGTGHPAGQPGAGYPDGEAGTAYPGGGQARAGGGRATTGAAGYPAGGQSPRAGYPAGYQGGYPGGPGAPAGGGFDSGAGGTGYPPGAGGPPYPEEKKPRRKVALILTGVVVLALLGGGTYAGVRFALAGNEPEAAPQRTVAPGQTEAQPGGEASVPATDPAGTEVAAPPSLAKPVVVDRIGLGQEPEGVTVSPDNRTIYVADQNSKDVHVVDVASKQVSVVKVPNTPRFLALSADGSRLYVTLFENNFTGNGLAVIDTAKRSLVKTIRTGPRPFEPAVAPDGRVWVPIHNGARVEIYDPQSLTEAARISVPPNPHWIVFTPDGRTAFTANHESSQISVVNVADGLVRKNFKVGRSPHALAVTPDGTRLVATNYDLDTVEVYDTGDQRLIHKINVGKEPQAVMISADGRHAYVVNEGSDNLSVIALGDGKVVSTVAVGDSPRVNAISPDGRRLYVTDGRGKTVTVLRTTEE
jgi:YVTN family beta-propeller protein